MTLFWLINPTHNRVSNLEGKIEFYHQSIITTAILQYHHQAAFLYCVCVGVCMYEYHCVLEVSAKCKALILKA